MNKLRDRKDVNRLALLFTFTYMVSYITRINYGAIISEMETATQISKSLLSMSLTGSFISYGAGQIISGIFGDRFSPKKLILYGLLGTSFINVLIPFCQNHVQMLVLWSINGFAQAFMWPPIVKLMTTLLSDDDYKKVVSKVIWGSSVGTIAVYVISPFLIWMSGWRAVFIFSALCSIVMSVIWNKYAYDVEVQPVKPVVRPEKGNIRIFLTPLMIAVMTAIIFQGMLRDGITTWMPSYIAETYSISNIISILSGVVLPIFSIACLQFATKLYMSKFTNPISCAGLFFGVGSFASLVLLLTTGKSAGVSIFCTAVLTGCMHCVNLMLICMLPPFFQQNGKVSTVSGILNSCTYVGSAVSTYVIAFFSERYGWSLNLTIWLCIAALGTVICLLSAGAWKRKYANDTN